MHENSRLSEYVFCNIFRRYAEFVEEKLKKLGMTVDILYPNEDVQMSRVLGNISSRGTLYAIIIEPINEEHDSLTVNILHGTPEGKMPRPMYFCKHVF